jgi:ABC-2 type transport system ATP-binding protein
LLLDEPTAGLDAVGKAAFWGYLLRLQKQGLTILLASHDTQELERYCQRVILMQRGRALAEGTPAALIGQIRGDLLALEFAEVSHCAQAPAVLQHLACISAVLPQGGGCSLTLEVQDGPAALPQIARLLAEAHLQVRRMTLSQPTLEDVFFRITGTALADTQRTTIQAAETGHTDISPSSGPARRRSPFQRHHERRQASEGRRP